MSLHSVSHCFTSGTSLPSTIVFTEILWTCTSSMRSYAGGGESSPDVFILA
eukprot:CAMPEP_0185836306 /NCGR_PEP_ID=MMETSP1353-20130828/9476_1 /TAXON_ID=1077150 /ORGANISM="Erythrolobus australicus, Strain CCMP3124" /LENGTH=50 /DNA_ID=CAMNT_0028535085 /DNA_START=48 /DNA_END=200 /DNA_ORIENTATION=+